MAIAAYCRGVQRELVFTRSEIEERCLGPITNCRKQQLYLYAEIMGFRKLKHCLGVGCQLSECGCAARE